MPVQLVLEAVYFISAVRQTTNLFGHPPRCKSLNIRLKFENYVNEILCEIIHLSILAVGKALGKAV